MLTGKRLGRGVDRGADDSPTLRLDADGIHVTVGEERPVERIEHRVGELEPCDESVHFGILQVVGLAQPGAHGVPLARREDYQADMAVAAAEHRIDGPGSVPGFRREPGLLSCDSVGKRPVRHLRHGFVHREVQHAAHPVHVAMTKSTERRKRGGRGGDVVAEPARRRQRLTVRRPRLESLGGGSGDDGVRGLPGGIGTGQAVGGDDENDEVWEAIKEVVVDRSGGDQDIGIGEEPVKLRPAVLGRVQLQDPFATVAEHPPEGDPLPNWRGVPGMGPTDRLHADDVGSKVPQEAGAELAPLIGLVKDPDPGEREHGGADWEAHASTTRELPKSRAISSGNSARAELSRSMLGGIRLNPPQTLSSWPVTHSD